jgi:hypothetical protein
MAVSLGRGVSGSQGTAGSGGSEQKGLSISAATGGGANEAVPLTIETTNNTRKAGDQLAVLTAGFSITAYSLIQNGEVFSVEVQRSAGI